MFNYTLLNIAITMGLCRCVVAPRHLARQKRFDIYVHNLRLGSSGPLESFTI